MVYWYTCSNLIYIYIYFFLFFFSFDSFFFKIWNSDADVKFSFVNSLPSWVSLQAHFFLLFRFHQLTVFIELVTVIPSLDTFTLSMGPTAVPVIRVPRVQTDLAT